VDSTTQTVVRDVQDPRDVAEAITQLEQTQPLPEPGIAGFTTPGTADRTGHN
jgi:hypothetical protein